MDATRVGLDEAVALVGHRTGWPPLECRRWLERHLGLPRVTSDGDGGPVVDLGTVIWDPWDGNPPWYWLSALDNALATADWQSPKEQRRQVQKGGRPAKIPPEILIAVSAEIGAEGEPETLVEIMRKIEMRLFDRGLDADESTVKRAARQIRDAHRDACAKVQKGSKPVLPE